MRGPIEWPKGREKEVRKPTGFGVHTTTVAAGRDGQTDGRTEFYGIDMGPPTNAAERQKQQ